MSADDPISRRRLLFGRFQSSHHPPRRGSGPAPAPGTGRVHRPPGAVDEPTFLRDCTRCGDCIAACPPDAITLAGPEYGPAAGTPIIDPMASPCVMCDDPPCIKACEPGVLSPDAPLRMGTASIREPNCLAFGGTICTVCVERCPVDGAMSLRDGKPVVHADACTGCGVCQHVCPAPYNAVLILPADRGGRVAADPPPPAGPDWRRDYFGDRPLTPPPGSELE